MNAPQKPITLDLANSKMAKVSIAQAIAKLNKYACMDTGDLYIALGDDHGFYPTEANRPSYVCEVWVMSGSQPISWHGIESDHAFASACTTLLGLRIARHIAAAQTAQLEARPWLDELSLVMLYASRVKDAASIVPIPLSQAMYDQALQHGVDMKLFSVVENADEHF